jgi:protein-tyrosine phosphatase
MPASKKSQAPKKSPSEIAPGVFVGGWKDATVFQGQRFCVLDELPDEEVPAEAHRTIYDDKSDAPVRKGLDEVAEMVSRARAKGEPVLLFCGHGVRRSPLAGAWYLHRAEGITLDAAYNRIRAVRPQVEHVRQWVGHWETLEERSGAH